MLLQNMQLDLRLTQFLEPALFETNILQKDTEKGKAPKSINRYDIGKGKHEKPHVHFKDGNALNQDGTWKHGGRKLTNKETKFLEKHDRKTE